MSTSIVQQDPQRPVKIVPTYSDEQIRLLADTIAKGCTESEMKFFMQVARMSRLNPFMNQIRPVKRWNSDLGREAMVIQVGIDGYRSMAADTGELAGIDDAIYDTEDEDHPKWAKVTVYRWSRGEKIPYTATARWSEYVQRKKSGEPNSMWVRMPFLMLAKCSEALALRKAFPAELAGIYTDEEMGQADNPDQLPQGKPQVQLPQKASEKKQEANKQETPAQKATTQPTAIEISGIIADAKPGKNGKDVWMELDNKLVVVGKDHATDEQRALLAGGNFCKLEVIKRHSEKLKGQTNPNGEFFETQKVVDIQIVQDESEDEILAEVGESNAVLEGEVVDPSESTESLKGLFDSGKVQTASSLPEGSGKKPGTIGSKRAQRLYAIMGQNSGKTGLTHEIVHQLLEKWPKVTSLSDLEVGLHDQFERIMKGEIEWKPILEE